MRLTDEELDELRGVYNERTPATRLHSALEELRALREKVERLSGDRDKYHDALVARHGGEPVALLEELDEVREQNRVLREALGQAIEAIESLAANELGNDPETGYPYRDELLYNLRAALGESGEEGE